METKQFRVYHWDTFDEPDDDTIFVSSYDTVEEAKEFVLKTYKISPDGADRIEIFDCIKRKIVQKYSITGKI